MLGISPKINVPRTAGTVKRALVVEGGGMRGAHSGGVLTEMYRRKMSFDLICSSSAGSCTAVFWLDDQWSRFDLCWRNYLHGDQFVRLRNAFLGKPILNLDGLIQKTFTELTPLDVDKVIASSIRIFITATDCETGKPHYFTNEPGTPILEALRAGAAMPLGYHLPVMVDGHPYADGGIADSIPVQKALDEDAEELWIVLTRPKGYRKDPPSRLNWERWIWGKYPKLVEAMRQRSEMYNEQMAMVERLEAAGKAHVIRPAGTPKISRFTRDRATLHAAVDAGHADAAAVLDKLGI